MITQPQLAPLYGKTQIVDGFGLNNVDDADETLIYIGLSDPRGNWIIKRFDLTSGKELRWASHTNNSDYDDYSNAWTDRATLTYGLYESIF